MHQLYACSYCKRHIRLSEPQCPFCGQVTVQKPTARRLPKTRISRAAIAAFGLSVGASLEACGQSSGPTTDATTDTQQVADSGDSGQTEDTGSPDSGADVVDVLPLPYGAPPSGLSELLFTV